MDYSSILFKLGFRKITPNQIKNWSEDRNLKMIIYASQKGDFRSRCEVAKCLYIFEYNQVENILLKLLHDKVFCVVENAIKTFRKFKLSKNIEIEIETIQRQWKTENAEMQKNWKKSNYKHEGLYIDKSKMKRLKELKYWMAKFKGSMSIG